MDLREITAVATRLRPQIQALAKQRDIASGKRLFWLWRTRPQIEELPEQFEN
jgi:hypothetical protein